MNTTHTVYRPSRTDVVTNGHTRRQAGQRSHQRGGGDAQGADGFV